MKKILLASSLVCFALVSCNNSDTNSQNFAKSPEELKIELIQHEQNDPTNYLFADGTYRENIWGNKLKVSCTITNNATLTTYKDVVVRVNYYSQTESVLATNEYTIYEYFQPNSSKTIEMKIENYSDVYTIGWDVVSALAVN